MLRWPIAAKEPIAIETIEMKTMICCHWARMPGKAPTKTRTASAIAAILGAEAKKAVTGVGAPS